MTDRPDLHLVEEAASEVAGGARVWSTREGWLAEGRRLGSRARRDRWALGDWAAEGARCHGDLTAAAAEIGLSAGALFNLASVARKIKPSRRREVLSWDHHAAVASLPAAAADRLLDRAEAEGWSREVMREEAHATSAEGQLARARARIAELEGQATSDPRDRTARARHAMARRQARVRALLGEAALLYREIFDVLKDPKAIADARALHGNTDVRRAFERIMNSGLDKCDRIMRDRIDPALNALEDATRRSDGVSGREE